jgi:hypothetical protein
MEASCGLAVDSPDPVLFALATTLPMSRFPVDDVHPAARYGLETYPSCQLRHRKQHKIGADVGRRKRHNGKDGLRQIVVPVPSHVEPLQKQRVGLPSSAACEENGSWWDGINPPGPFMCPSVSTNIDGSDYWVERCHNILDSSPQSYASVPLPSLTAPTMKHTVGAPGIVFGTNNTTDLTAWSHHDNLPALPLYQQRGRVDTSLLSLAELGLQTTADLCFHADWPDFPQESGWALESDPQLSSVLSLFGTNQEQPAITSISSTSSIDHLIPTPPPVPFSIDAVGLSMAEESLFPPGRKSPQHLNLQSATEPPFPTDLFHLAGSENVGLGDYNQQRPLQKQGLDFDPNLDLAYGFDLNQNLALEEPDPLPGFLADLPNDFPDYSID